MTYRKLSELINELENPQQSEVFVRLFRSAVREGKVDAFDLPERFTLPKLYRKRGGEGTSQRQVKDMLFEDTPTFKKWFTETTTALAKKRLHRPKVKPSLEAVESGALDFKALAAETRRKLQARYEHGQQLGQKNSRKRKKK